VSRDVPRPHHCEVPVIQGCDLREPQAFCDGYYGGIDDAERKIDISLHEIGHAADVLILNFQRYESRRRRTI
jgi:hypothetical protein